MAVRESSVPSLAARPRQDQFARGRLPVGQTCALSAIFKAFGVELAAINSPQTAQYDAILSGIPRTGRCSKRLDDGFEAIGNYGVLAGEYITLIADLPKKLRSIFCAIRLSAKEGKDQCAIPAPPPPCLVGFFIMRIKGRQSRNMTASRKNTSIKASMAACCCTMPYIPA